MEKCEACLTFSSIYKGDWHIHHGVIYYDKSFTLCDDCNKQYLKMIKLRTVEWIYKKTQQAAEDQEERRCKIPHCCSTR